MFIIVVVNKREFIMRTILRRKIFAYECDIYSHLNHSRYFNYFEEARSYYFSMAKIPISSLTSNSIFVFVTGVKSDFKSELSLEEEIIISTEIQKLSPLRIKWFHKIFNSQDKLCNCTEVETVFIKNKKPIRLYQNFYKKLAEFSMNVKLAIPSENEKLCSHFGHCQQFAIYNIENDKILKSEFVNTPEHTPGAFPKFLNELGVKVVIAGGMGNKAQAHFKNQGIELITGADEPELNILVQNYIEGKLESKEVKCNHH